MIAMTEGSELGEHENPGEATVLVLHGRGRLKKLRGRDGAGELLTVAKLA